MSAPTRLTGNKISLTYDRLTHIPDPSNGVLYDGLGYQAYTNCDSIGTIKMFYPMSGVLTDYFNEYPGDGMGVVGKLWEGWAICDGRNGTPDLRGRFVVGKSNIDNTDYGYTNDEKNLGDYGSFGDNGGERFHLLINTELPPHKHEFNYHRFSFDAGHAINNGDAVDTINNGGIPSYGSGNGVTNNGPTDTNGGVPQTPHENRPPFYTLLYVIKVS